MTFYQCSGSASGSVGSVCRIHNTSWRHWHRFAALTVGCRTCKPRKNLVLRYRSVGSVAFCFICEPPIKQVGSRSPITDPLLRIRTKTLWIRNTCKIYKKRFFISGVLTPYHWIWSCKTPLSMIGLFISSDESVMLLLLCKYWYCIDI
jgi:hypothetical protein